MTRVFIVTDCTVLSLGFEALAAHHAAFSVLGSSGAQDALQRLERERPDVVVVDQAIDGGGAIPLCEAIFRRWPALPILVLSSSLDDDAVRTALGAGARGYLYKNADGEHLRTAIERLSHGEAVLDPKVTRRVIDWATRDGGSVQVAAEGLSGREIDVLRLVSRGEPNKRIAKKMGLTENTVKTYLRRAYRKLGCNSRSAAAAVLGQRGLL